MAATYVACDGSSKGIKAGFWMRFNHWQMKWKVLSVECCD